ncbi:FtsW/RodA/SpoVE family cell cycle protein [Erysipelothrix sp. HDW6A]|uniref:FtsW/RodA/SpoVE family cell cycle protein n=1 Tax=Erysipelothrix sp. HDW6A TaxID=2714928 RepID=UPI00140B0503|nr:FtsW/RodA/SpoVE family cell cycle protein [Erysipelothrix sp. HDW6A]QIK57384.1 FtsW/RodA/SpoVE family cell cycle protein [Erysipelothrix sp. HDW6A]
MKKNKLKNIISLRMPAGYSKLIHGTVIVLSLFGVLMVTSATMGKVSVGKTLFAGGKELFFVCVGYFMMVFFARRFSFNYFKKYLVVITLAVIGSLLLTMFFSSAGGASAWIRFGQVTIQPSEFAKVYMVLLIAVSLGDKHKVRVASGIDLVKRPVLVLLTIILIVTVLQRDLGSAAVILAISLLCFLIPSQRKLSKLQKWVLILLVVGVFTLIFLDTPTGLKIAETIFSKLGIPEYMFKRFESAANPFLDRYNEGYQLFMGLAAMVQGLQAGPFGKGFTNSDNKFGYLPEAQTDFIIAIIVEELGILGILIVVISYGVILFNLYKYAILARFEAEKIVLIGAASYFAIHFILNIGGATGLIPLTGVPLILVSAGGSSRMAAMIMIGLAQNIISRTNSSQRQKAVQST